MTRLQEESVTEREYEAAGCADLVGHSSPALRTIDQLGPPSVVRTSQMQSESPIMLFDVANVCDEDAADPLFQNDDEEDVQAELHHQLDEVDQDDRMGSLSQL